MRALTKLLLVFALALTLSTPAGAVVSIGLVQVDGTYDGSSANPGDTLVLNITYALQPGDAVTLLDPAIVWNVPMATFHPELSTETGPAYCGPGPDPCFEPILTGDIWEPVPGLADGWEKGTTIAGGGTSPCVFGACTSLGTAYFVLSGSSGTFAIGAVGLPYGTVIGDGTFVDIAGISNLGTFTVIPEPTTASLLGLALLGLTAAHRRRRS
jgi:hypothetical protein